MSNLEGSERPDKSRANMKISGCRFNYGRVLKVAQDGILQESAL